MKGIEFQAHGRVASLPSDAPDLQSKAESFLQSAKLAIRQTGLLLKPIYKVVKESGREIGGHNYDDIAKWAAKEFGPDRSQFAKEIEGLGALGTSWS